ncbi:hypothetical protein, partial [Bradyrhizobium sp. AUGA SZCCT0182]|uniref:hypothetical protein n=1 Tax=Bradyrhizobium sp. AUGA SZCCT0182 TaxID=2807667 RepID=UPI001BAC0594
GAYRLSNGSRHVSSWHFSDIANLAGDGRFCEKQTSLLFDLRLAAHGAKRSFGRTSMSAR